MLNEILEVKCFLCQGSSFSTLFPTLLDASGHQYQLLKCQRCGILVIYPVPTTTELMVLYDNKEYFEVYRENQRWKEWNGKNHFRPMLNLIHRYSSPSMLLDIGCSDGWFLKLARDNGWTPQGVELSHDSCEYARKKYGLEVFCGSLEEANFKDTYFDVVTMSHILEHFANPLSTLKEVRRILKPGGVLYVAVPNLDEKVHRLLSCGLITRILGKDIPRRLSKAIGSIYPPGHLVVFSTNTLSLTLEEAGFHVEEIVYTSKIRPLFMGRWRWIRDKFLSLPLKLLHSGLCVEMLAKKVD